MIMPDDDAAKIARLEAEVVALRREHDSRYKVIDDMAADVKLLLAMANQGKGGIWMGMTIAGMIGSAISWIATHMVFK